jgi:hypothetical protein
VAALNVVRRVNGGERLERHDDSLGTDGDGQCTAGSRGNLESSS